MTRLILLFDSPFPQGKGAGGLGLIVSITKRVLVADPIAQEGVDLLRRESDVEVRIGLKPPELREIIGDYAGLVVRSETKVTADIIGAASQLEVVGRAGVGVDNIDIETATQRGVLVVNSPTGNVLAAAEHTIALMMALSRNIPQANRAMREGRWDRHKYQGVQIMNKTLGVVGLGRVGQEVALRAQGLRMRVVAYDPFLPAEAAERVGVELLPLDHVLREADYLTFHLPLTPDTRRLINAERLALLKPGARLINTSRGGVIDEGALHEALQNGQLAGAALDVFEKEPYQGPLTALPNVITTPHLGGSTLEAQIDVAVDVAEQVLTALRGEPVPNAINLPSLPRERLSEVARYLVLAEQLGVLLGRLVQGPVDSLEVRYAGTPAQRDTGLITLAAVKGVLKSYLAEQINLVNARVIASRRGLRVSEEKQMAEGEWANLLTLVAHSGGREHMVAGTLFAGQQPRLLAIDHYRVDVELSRYVLITLGIDQPGVIGGLGTILGRHQVNIAFMQVGRDRPGQRAVSLLLVDEPVPDQVVAELRQINGVMDMIFVDLGA